MDTEKAAQSLHNRQMKATSVCTFGCGRWRNGPGGLEGELEEELLGLLVPEGPELLRVLVDFVGGELERDRLIGLRREEKVLPPAVRRLHLITTRAL